MPRKKKLGVGKVSKSRIISNVAKNTKLPQTTVKLVFDEIFSAFIAELSAGNTVTIHGFGSFDHKFTEGKVCKNPKTQEKVNVPQKIVPYFAPGRNLSAAFEENREILLSLLASKPDSYKQDEELELN
jgi:DNA-binding protein HU-beta